MAPFRQLPQQVLADEAGGAGEGEQHSGNFPYWVELLSRPGGSNPSSLTVFRMYRGPSVWSRLHDAGPAHHADGPGHLLDKHKCNWTTPAPSIKLRPRPSAE